MLRHLVIAVFLFFCCIALGMVIHREYFSPDRQRVSNKKHKVVISQFHYVKYKDVDALQSMRGDQALLSEPNQLKAFGDLMGVRKNTQEESIKAQEAHVWFDSNSIAGLVSGSDINWAVAKNDVKILSQFGEIYSEKVEFNPALGAITSDQEVRAVNSSGAINSSSGFNYSLDQENLELLGPIKGRLVNEN